MTTEKEPGPLMTAHHPPQAQQSGGDDTRTDTSGGSLSPIRAFLNQRGSGKLADNSFAGLVLASACSIFVIILFILFILLVGSRLSLGQFGWRFFARQAWDPVSGSFGALPFIYGTLITSFLALLIAVPLALGVAIFLTELCPRALRSPVSFLTELLAAIPSVVYGLWGIFVLVPLVRDDLGPFLLKTLGWTGLFPDQTSVSVC